MPASLKSMLTDRMTGLAAIKLAAETLIKQIDKDIARNGNDGAYTVAVMDGFDTARTAYETLADAVVFPTVDIDETTYDITEAEVSYKGTIYTAEYIAGDAVLAEEMLDAGVTFLVPQA